MIWTPYSALHEPHVHVAHHTSLVRREGDGSGLWIKLRISKRYGQTPRFFGVLNILRAERHNTMRLHRALTCVYILTGIITLCSDEKSLMQKLCHKCAMWMFCRRVLNWMGMVDVRVCEFDESYMALYSLKHVLLYQFSEPRILCEILPPSSHLSSLSLCLSLAHCTCTLNRLYSLWLMQSMWIQF